MPVNGRRAKLQVMGGEPSSGSHTDGLIARIGCSLQCAILLAYWWVLLSSASGSAVTSIAGIAVPVGGRWPGSGEA
jgi:hypothetical protein